MINFEISGYDDTAEYAKVNFTIESILVCTVYNDRFQIEFGAKYDRLIDTKVERLKFQSKNTSNEVYDKYLNKYILNVINSNKGFIIKAVFLEDYFG